MKKSWIVVATTLFIVLVVYFSIGAILNYRFRSSAKWAVDRAIAETMAATGERELKERLGDRLPNSRWEHGRMEVVPRVNDFAKVFFDRDMKNVVYQVALVFYDDKKEIEDINTYDEKYLGHVVIWFRDDKSVRSIKYYRAGVL